MSASDTPLLYKYRDWNNPYHKSLLTKGEIYFSHVTSFNDPFDQGAPFRFDKLDPETFAQTQLEITKRVYPEMPQNELDVIHSTLLEDFELRKSEGRLFELVETHLNKIQDGVGVFSLSLLPTNILMWSYYANNHEGFCVGLDPKHLVPDDSYIIKQVHYQNDYPDIIPGADNLDNYFKSLTTKYSRWGHEEEIRLLRGNGARTLVQLAPDAFKVVYFGCKTEKAVKKEIIQVCQRNLPYIQFIQLQRHKTKFELESFELEQVDIDDILT